MMNFHESAYSSNREYYKNSEPSFNPLDKVVNRSVDINNSFNEMNIMGTLEIFKYRETPVTFKTVNGEIFINATEMARSFRKLPATFLKSKGPETSYMNFPL